jgi:ABC-type maltose transport system permease subunit
MLSIFDIYDSSNDNRAQAATEKLAHNPSARTKRIRQSVFMCLGCVSVSTVIVVMEAYCILALQFCDGEDLISLYWSTWTMIQVGSLIAMIGIILALAHTLRGRQHP